MRARILALTAALAIPLAAAHAQFYEYALDDGSGNFTIGPSQFDANMTWLNAFNADPAGQIISSVRVSFGDIADNDGNLGPDHITVAVLDDPNDDADPADAVLLTTGTGQWVDLASNQFIDIPVPPTMVSGGFFVAVEMDVIQRANPARMDPQDLTLGMNSWMFYNPESRLHDLGGSKFILRMGDSPFVGAWMIRADARACLADISEPQGLLDVFDVFVFLDLFNAGSASADVTNDGTLDIFDVFALLDAFNAGCP
ncbi:MAG: hypothetical protein KC996_10525 [Phycisphaerales bacterium]|nr:hypothetical protein [Phycisphaerales bacterium]